MADSGLRGSWGSGRVGLLVAVALSALGCGAPSSGEQASEPTVAADDVIVCMRAQTLPSGEVIPAEWYSVFAMNNKLKHFPEFAATTGVASVSSCSEARQFYDAYEAYEDAYPNFDEHEPIDDYPLTKVPPPSHDRAKIMPVGEVSKIKNGVGDLLKPVVSILGKTQATNVATGGSCTAAYIARNFLITAAHCLATKEGFKPIDAAHEADAEIETWYKYDIQTAEAGGVSTPADEIQYPNVLQFYDHRFPGFRQSPNVHSMPFDFAMLFVWYDDDNMLPNNLPGQTGKNVPYLRVSLRKSVDTSNATAWGYGAPDLENLFRADLDQYIITAEPSDMEQGEFVGEIPDDPNGPVVCKGDSGGPLVDQYPITAANGVSSMEYVAAGVLSSSTGGDPLCAAPSAKTFWARTEIERVNIQRWVAAYYPLFHCNPKKSDGAVVEDYLQCWGQPCNSTADTAHCAPGQYCCPSGQYCLHPGSELTMSSCPQCGPSSGNCGCMFGQCFASPTLGPDKTPPSP